MIQKQEEKTRNKGVEGRVREKGEVMRLKGWWGGRICSKGSEELVPMRTK